MIISFIIILVEKAGWDVCINLPSFFNNKTISWEYPSLYSLHKVLAGGAVTIFGHEGHNIFK